MLKSCWQCDSWPEQHTKNPDKKNELSGLKKFELKTKFNSDFFSVSEKNQEFEGVGN